MDLNPPAPRLRFQGARGRWLVVAGTLLTAGLCGPAFADTPELDAKLAITRAQASIDLISKESPAATNDKSFGSAQQKLADARDAASHKHDREAVWLANEAELFAEATAGAAKLAGLDQTRSAISHDIDVLQLELNKK